MTKLPSKKMILMHFDARDPIMAAVIREKGAFKLSRNRNYFLVLCKAIIGQQISIKAADSITKRVQSLFKNKVIMNSSLTVLLMTNKTSNNYSSYFTNDKILVWVSNENSKKRINYNAINA